MTEEHLVQVVVINKLFTIHYRTSYAQRQRPSLKFRAMNQGVTQMLTAVGESCAASGSELSTVWKDWEPDQNLVNLSNLISYIVAYTYIFITVYMLVMSMMGNKSINQSITY